MFGDPGAWATRRGKLFGTQIGWDLALVLMFALDRRVLEGAEPSDRGRGWRGGSAAGAANRFASPGGPEVIISDTNVVSEFMRDEPDPSVLTWAGSFGPSDLTICMVTVEEIERGIRRLPTSKRRRQLEQRWQRLVAAFHEAIVAYDVEAAEATARVLVSTETAGRPMSLADAQIAGICLAGGHQLATRNVRDFEAVADLTVLNPFG